MPISSGFFRAQMNTLEWLPIFLPSLWLFAIYIGDGTAALLGLVWVIGRILYIVGYAQATAKRGPGFYVAGACNHRALGRRARRHRLAHRSRVTIARILSNINLRA